MPLIFWQYFLMMVLYSIRPLGYIIGWFNRQSTQRRFGQLVLTIWSQTLFEDLSHSLNELEQAWLGSMFDNPSAISQHSFHISENVLQAVVRGWCSWFRLYGVPFFLIILVLPVSSMSMLARIWQASSSCFLALIGSAVSNSVADFCLSGSIRSRFMFMFFVMGGALLNLVQSLGIMRQFLQSRQRVISLVQLGLCVFSSLFLVPLILAGYAAVFNDGSAIDIGMEPKA